jgi:hypothetical protein
MSSDSYEKQVLDAEYQLMLDHLNFRSQSPTFSLEEIKMELTHLLVYQGQDWGGRGALKNAEIQAHIYAYEIFIKRYSDAHSIDA